SVPVSRSLHRTRYPSLAPFTALGTRLSLLSPHSVPVSRSLHRTRYPSLAPFTALATRLPLPPPHAVPVARSLPHTPYPPPPPPPPPPPAPVSRSLPPPRSPSLAPSTAPGTRLPPLHTILIGGTDSRTWMPSGTPSLSAFGDRPRWHPAVGARGPVASPAHWV